MMYLRKSSKSVLHYVASILNFILIKSMEKNNIEINIYGGNIQVMPNVKEVEQHIHTKDGETVIINKFKP